MTRKDDAFLALPPAMLYLDPRTLDWYIAPEQPQYTPAGAR